MRLPHRQRARGTAYIIALTAFTFLAALFTVAIQTNATRIGHTGFQARSVRAGQAADAGIETAVKAICDGRETGETCGPLTPGSYRVTWRPAPNDSGRYEIHAAGEMPGVRGPAAVRRVAAEVVIARAAGVVSRARIVSWRPE